jgi:hypothetical protein
LPLVTPARQALFEAKLTALVRDRWGNADGELTAFGGGAALVSPGGCFILVHDADHRVLGQALAWAQGRDAAALHLLVEGPAELCGVLSRRAAAFAFPATVWRIDGRALQEVAPAPFPPSMPLPPDAARCAEMLVAAGAEPVVEFGVLTGEVLGLEVARLVADPDGWRLEVGVGRHDRQAHRMLYPHRSVEAGLAEVVGAVRRLRRPGVRTQLANTVAAERWLRAVVVAHPDLIGARRLEPVPPPVARTDLRLPTPAPAAGVGRDGAPLMVVCSTGVDLDLVPSAADARLADGRDGVKLVLAVPPGDDHPRTRQLAAALADPAEVVTVPAEWRNLPTSGALDRAT